MPSNLNDGQPRLVYETYIRSTPDRLWEALTTAQQTRQYYYGTGVESTWKKGSPITYKAPDGSVPVKGEVVEVNAPERLVTTFELGGPDHASDRPSRVTFAIEPAGKHVSKLTLTHDGFEGETSTYRSVAPGWVPIVAGLKTLLETGEPLGLEM